ncbi:hypothetical protein C8J55DRAFT_503082, partial [Lentinula edodes]
MVVVVFVVVIAVVVWFGMNLRNVVYIFFVIFFFFIVVELSFSFFNTPIPNSISIQTINIIETTNPPLQRS